jgi:hypothetical protein
MHSVKITFTNHKILSFINISLLVTMMCQKQNEYNNQMLSLHKNKLKN